MADSSKKKKVVTGTAKEVKRRGEGLGTGPVGKNDGRAEAFKQVLKFAAGKIKK